MGYRVLGKSEEIFNGYSKIAGLEGPFLMGYRVLYYDPKEGMYYDSKTDLYVEHDEVSELNKYFLEKFKN